MYIGACQSKRFYIQSQSEIGAVEGGGGGESNISDWKGVHSCLDRSW